VDPKEQEPRRQEQLARWSNEDLVLFAVIGLRRVRGGNQSGVGSATVGVRRDPVHVVMSQQVRFVDDDSGSIAITSHREDGHERYERTRSWASGNAYLRSSQGKASQAAWDRSGPRPRPLEDLVWAPISILVDGQETPFEVYDLGEGIWTAVGQTAGTIISIDSRGVPLSSVRLERLSEHGFPPPPPPDLGENGPTVVRALDQRFERVPFGRVRSWADYWALRAVEVDHARNLTRRHRLTRHHSEALERYWLERIEAHLAEKLDSFDGPHSMSAMHRSRIARHLRSGLLFQLWFITLGPGARTWFGNRYVGIRHYTFRIRWRP
jgi:hypothetical protein